MTDKEKAKLTEVFDYFSQDVNVVPIGSRVWGGATEKSDYDFCMDDVVFKKLIPRLEELGILIVNLYGMSENSERDTIMKNIGNYKFDLFKVPYGLPYSRTEGPVYEKVLVNIITYAPDRLLALEDINQVFTAIEGTELHKRICGDKATRVAVFECFREIMFSSEPTDTDSDFPF